jgi:SAM-dependent methyltransferase
MDQVPTKSGFASVLGFLKEARRKTLDQAPSAGAFANIYYSGTTYALWRAAEPVTRRCATGLVLDAGSGRGAWRDTIIRNGAVRESVDIAPKHGEQVTWIADLTDMPQVPSDRYDAAVCHQVLEHVPKPQAAIDEIYRTLKPGGILVISVPHLSRQHELPHDYFRFTPGGLARVLRDAGFEVEELTTYGGLLTFVHHQVSALLLGAAAILRPLYWVVTLLNAPFSIGAAATDRLIDRHGLLANGVLAVARKPDA